MVKIKGGKSKNNINKKKHLLSDIQLTIHSTSNAHGKTIENSYWQEEFDKFVGSKTPLRKRKVVRKQICADFNRDDSYNNSQSGFAASHTNKTIDYTKDPKKIFFVDNYIINRKEKNPEVIIPRKINPVSSTPIQNKKPLVYFNSSSSPILSNDQKYEQLGNQPITNNKSTKNSTCFDDPKNKLGEYSITPTPRLLKPMKTYAKKDRIKYGQMVNSFDRIKSSPKIRNICLESIGIQTNSNDSVQKINHKPRNLNNGDIKCNSNIRNVNMECNKPHITFKKQNITIRKPLREIITNNQTEKSTTNYVNNSNISLQIITDKKLTNLSLNLGNNLKIISPNLKKSEYTKQNSYVTNNDIMDTHKSSHRNIPSKTNVKLPNQKKLQFRDNATDSVNVNLKPSISKEDQNCNYNKRMTRNNVCHDYMRKATIIDCNSNILDDIVPLSAKLRQSRFFGQRKTVMLRKRSDILLPFNFDNSTFKDCVGLSNGSELTYSLDQIDVDKSNIHSNSLSNEPKIKLQHSVSLTAPRILYEQSETTFDEDICKRSPTQQLHKSSHSRKRRSSSVLVTNSTINRYRSISPHVIDIECLTLSFIDTVNKLAATQTAETTKTSVKPTTTSDISLLSINSVDHSPRKAVLRRCEQDQPIHFQEIYNETTLRHCRKIGEGVYGEVFMNKTAAGKAKVLKIIPIEGTIEVNGECQKKFDEVLSEIIIAIELSALANGSDFMTHGFVDVLKVHCIQGRYPQHLVDLWELYRENYNTENDHPEIFADDQLYIVFELENAGQDLESFHFNNALQAYSAFEQIALTLAIAEKQFQFEHRDLHWGNVLLSLTDDKYIEFKLNGKIIEIPSHGVKVTIIDYTLSRMVFNGCCLYNDLSNFDEPFSSSNNNSAGGGDYQFEVYRIMRRHLENEWERYEPYTNIVWLHYIVDKLINGARYKNSKSRKHRSVIQEMMLLRDNILDYKSAYEYVQTDELKL